MNLRISNYNIYTKLPNSNEYLLVHGYTGAVDVVSEGIYDTLNQAKNDCSNLNKLAEEHLQVLEDRGYITYKTPEEEIDSLKKIATVIKNTRSKLVSIYLAITYNCNFRCSYCYENHLLAHGKEWLEKTISFKTIDAVFEHIKLLRSKGKHIDVINLYGGEPLLKENYNVVKYIVNKCIELDLKLKAITNAYDLEYFKEFLGNERGKIASLQITIDGNQKEHDQKRFLVGKKPTFAKIMENIDLALDNGVAVAVRSNLDYANAESMNEVRALFAKNEWDKNKLFFDYTYVLEPNFSNKSEKLSKNKLLSKISTDKTFREKISFFSNIYSIFANAFKEKSFINFNTDYCGAILPIILIDPQDKIYPCLDVVGKENLAIGDISIDGELCFNEKYSYWTGRTVDNIEECVKCPYALICKGGCPAEALKASGSIYNSHCKIFKEAFKEILPQVYAKIILD